VRSHRGAAWRWALVVAVVVLLGSAPRLLRLPATDGSATAGQLRERALASAALPYSGYAQSSGTLALPSFGSLPSVAAGLTGVADLLSDRTTMRVWWRSPADNRVDVVTPSGETDVHRDPAGTWTWDYGARTATRTLAVPLALPTAPDLVPSALGRRLLSEAVPAELSRTGARRVAGRDALGVRVRPSQDAASVGTVDVWVDRATGLPLEVEVTGRGLTQPSLDTRFLDLDPTRPPAAVTAWDPPAGVTARTGGDVLLLASAFLRQVRLPGELAGLPRRDTPTRGGPGLYGRGVTLLAATPVPRSLAGPLGGLLDRTTGVVADDLGRRAAVGPLGLMLVEPPRGPRYLLAGTVTLDALAAAAAQLTGSGA
jgi:hypothetical protein